MKRFIEGADRGQSTFFPNAWKVRLWHITEMLPAAIDGR